MADKKESKADATGAANTNTETRAADPVEVSGAPSPDHFEKGSGDAGQSEVQERVDEAEDKGYIGVKADPLDNSVYSMEGGAPGTEATRPAK